VAKGKKTPTDKVVTFRQHYLRTGNAAEAARRCKLPLTSGRTLAQAADRDPEFVEARRKRLAQGHETVGLALLEAAEIVLDALRSGPLTDSYDSPIDRRAELARSLTGIFDSLDRVKARVEAKTPPETADASVTINVRLKPGPEQCEVSTSTSTAPSPEPTSS
jgi:hypothetical protein